MSKSKDNKIDKVDEGDENTEFSQAAAASIIPPHLMMDDDKPRSSMVLRLLESHSARRVLEKPSEDLGLAENQPFPFMGLVGQLEMRTALLLAAVNPNIGGVLLIGPRGTGKTTASRGLSALLPYAEHSMCTFGCMPEDYEVNGAEGVCHDCAAKMEADERISQTEPVRLVELPLNARIEDVIGGINERIALQHSQVRINRGILSRADRNLLYVDEVNLLEDEIVDAILDAAAQGHYAVRRGAMQATYRARFTLIGSMNPEEGNLRPQILDRFGLRVIVMGLTDTEERMTVYERVRDFRENPSAVIQSFDQETFYAREDVITAREMLSTVKLSTEAKKLGMALIKRLEIHSHRAEFTLFEATRAYAALDMREEATVDDLREIAAISLRMRKSEFINQFIEKQLVEDQTITSILENI